MEEIAPHVYVEADYALVTVGAILSSEGWVCIDTPPLPRDAKHWRATLQGISDQPIRYVINTDHHRDRVLGNAWFDAPVVAHQAAAEQMLNLGGSFIAQAAEELSANDNELVQIASLKVVPPQISYEKAITLHCGKHRIELVNKPSATRGNTWVILKEEKVVFTGDSIVVDRHPYVMDGVSKEWLDALRLLRLERYSEWKVVIGRGEVTNNTASEPLAEYLRVARRRIKSLCHAGRPRSDVGQLVPEFLEMFPYPGFQREQTQRRVKAGLEAIYEEIRATGDENDDDE